MTPDDLDLVESQLGDPRVISMVPAPWTREECRTLIVESLHWCRGSFLLFDRASGDFVGECGLNPVEVEGAQEVEIGYNVCPDLWGRGPASEAGRACLEFARTTAHLPRVIALIDPRNERSMRTAARIGMKLERDAIARDRRYALWAIDW